MAALNEANTTPLTHEIPAWSRNAYMSARRVFGHRSDMLRYIALIDSLVETEHLCTVLGSEVATEQRSASSVVTTVDHLPAGVGDR